MKQTGLRKMIAGVLAIVLSAAVLLAPGIYKVFSSDAEENEGSEIVWDFETGELAPFYLVSGSYGTIVTNIPWTHNSPVNDYPRQGDYHLSTLETATYYAAGSTTKWEDPTRMTLTSESYLCEIRSPMFRLDDPVINFLVGGGNTGVYVALCDMYGREIVRATGRNSEDMYRVEWNLKYEDLVGQYVFVKIVDEASGGWGHITFDDFHAVGYVDAEMEVQPLPPNEIHWSFENGALTPFRVTEGSFGVGIIADWVYERNSPYGPINKDGDYFLSTLEGDTANRPYYIGNTGTIVSPTFSIQDPVVTLKLGGGSLQDQTEDQLYVALVRESDGTILTRYTLEELPTYTYNGKTAASGHMLTDVTLTIPEAEYTEGENVYLKIVDHATTGWGFIIVDDIRAKGDVIYSVHGAAPTTYETVAWDFEDGTIAPFTVTEGSNLNNVMITDVSYDWNIKTGSSVAGHEIGKNGTYWLNTYFHIIESNHRVPKQNVTDGVYTGRSGGYGSEAYLGQLRSPAFVLDPVDPTITMQLGGNKGNSVSVYDYTTGTKVGAAASAAGSWVMQTCSVEWNSGFTYSEGQVLYLQIEDNTTKSYGFICVDNIQFRGGLINDSYETIHWSFEDGTCAPFTAEIGATFNQELVTDLSYDFNMSKGKTVSSYAIGKHGDYWLSTGIDRVPVFTVTDGTCTAKVNGAYNLNVTGYLRSPCFVLNPENTAITMQLGGSPSNRVSVYDVATGEQVGAATSAAADWKMQTRSVVWNSGFSYTPGQALYLQIEDNTTDASAGGWQFICVDDISFSGSMLDFDYAAAVWSFESGTIHPFRTESSWGGGIIAAYNNNQTMPHGTNYLNTVLSTPSAGSPYDNNYMGELVSPEFLLDPRDPVITLSVMGGNANSNAYVAVYNAETGEELSRTYGNNSWAFYERELDLTGKFLVGDRLVMKIIDGGTASWAWIGVDNIRGSFYFPETAKLTTLNQVMKATGWYDEDFELLVEMIEDNQKTYSAQEYDAEDLLDRVEEMRTKQRRMAQNGVKATDSELTTWISDMNALSKEVQLANPLLGDGLLLFTVHYQYKLSHHNTHTMFPAYNGEIDDKVNYTPGGAVKLLNLKTGEITTLLEDADGLYRDIDVSYDSDKILLSYRENRDSTYNIIEYTLSDDRKSIIDTRQLTSLTTSDDMDPLYMPDGNIVFASTRDPKYVMCNRHISSNLYRMESDGANIVKITDSTLFERPTDVLPDGRIIYDRWEYNDRDFASAQGLWTVYEDGTKQDVYYGNNSPTGATIEAKSIPGTEKVAVILSSCHDRSWGALAVLDRSQGIDGKDAVLRTWPAEVQSKIGDPGTNANNIDAYKFLSIKYEDAQPLSEDYILVSRTLPGQEKMAIYLVDSYGHETLLYEDASDMSAFDATLIQSRSKEIQTPERRNYNDDVGYFYVQDVYAGTNMAGVERGTVKTLRIVESLDKKYMSQSRQWQGEGQQNPGVNWHSFEVKRVIGEVPVYEDGSAYFEVPQDVFVYFQLLDEDGKMIQSMRSGTLIQSGETTGCVGCHEDRHTAPITNTMQEMSMALKASIRVVANPDYVEGSDLPKTVIVNQPDVPQKRIFDETTKTDFLVDYNDPEYFEEYTDLPTMNFLTEVQPIFTNNCLQCHGYENPEANLSLVPDKDVIFNAAYINLWIDRDKKGVLFENLLGAVGGGDSRFYNAKAWGSYNSPLIQKIYDDETHKNLLTDAEKRRVAEWVDLNAPYYGDYSTNYGFNNGGRSPLTDSERISLGDSRTLGWSTMTLSNLNKAIYFDNPEKSPILKGKTGTEYNDMLAIIQTGLERLRINPDVDWNGLTAVPGNPSLSINPYRQNTMDVWRTEKVALYDAMEAANRAAIRNGIKLYDSDHEAVMAEHNAAWPGWPTVSNTGNYYTQLPE